MAWALTLCFLATSGTDTLSASRRIATICSSVKRLFFIGSSLVGGSHSLKLRLVLRTWAGHEDVRLFVWQRDRGQCVKCGSKQRLEFDHIIPVAAGGSNTERNIQLLCESCNRAKGSTI